MADGLTIDMDTTAVIAALRQLGDAAQPFINAASAVTAKAILAEAQSRLQRQLGPNATGATLAGLAMRQAFDGNGFIVISEREPFPSLPLWIEKGTKKGKSGSHTAPARPYFYVSALLEEGNHFRRITEAVSSAIAQQGLGD